MLAFADGVSRGSIQRVSQRKVKVSLTNDFKEIFTHPYLVGSKHFQPKPVKRRVCFKLGCLIAHGFLKGAFYLL